MITPAVYVFTHRYLNTMQQGIQSAHAIAELFTKYAEQPEYFKKVIDWSANHKTLRILDAGSGKKFEDTYRWYTEFVKKFDLSHAEFREPDINDMITAFCFVLSESDISSIKLHDYDPLAIRPYEGYHLTTLSSFKSAR